MATKSDKRDRQQRAEQMRRAREKTEKRRRSIITVVIGVIVLAIVAVAAVAIWNASNKSKEVTLPKASGDVAGATTVTKGHGFVYDQEVATGKSSGGDPIKVVVYEDFQCPACGAFESTTGPVLAQQVADGKISVEYRNVDFIDKMVGSGDYSRRSARAAACVFEDTGMKGFYKFHQLLYANQPEEGGGGLENTQLNEFAKQAGADDARKCINSSKFDNFVEKTTKTWSKDHSGTPTIIVDGKEVKGSGQNYPTTAQVQAAIDKVAKK